MIDWLRAVQELEKAPAAPVYVLLGTERHLVREFVTAVVERLTTDLKEPADLNRFSFEEEGCQGAVDACLTVSLFATGAVQVLEDCTALLSGARVKQARVDTGPLERYVVNPAHFRVLIVVAPGDKFDERKKLVKLMRANAVVVDCSTPKEGSALAILQREARKREVQVGKDALAELFRRSGSVSMAVSDLCKAAVYAAGRPVSLADIEETVASSADDNIFAWIDLAVTGRAADALAGLDDVVRGGNDPFAVVALLARQCRLMYYAAMAGRTGESINLAAGRVGAPPFALRAAAKQVQRLSIAALEDLLVSVADIEWELKSGRRDPRHAVEWLVLQFAEKQSGLAEIKVNRAK